MVVWVPGQVKGGWTILMRAAAAVFVAVMACLRRRRQELEGFSLC